MSTPAASAALWILAFEPTRIGAMKPASAASTAAVIASGVQGWATAVASGASLRARSTSRWNRSWLKTRTSGSATRGRLTFSVGALTSAWPVITASPAWLTHRQSSTTTWCSGRFSITVTDAVMVSPTVTGRVKRSDWAR